MQRIEYVIKDELGIHARPAGALVKEAARFQADIKIQKEEKEADAKRLFSVMGLAIKKGECVTITAEGTDEVKAIEAMENFLRSNL